MTDLNLLDVATGTTRQLLVHDREGGAYDRPTWSPDGRTIYADHVAPVLDGPVVRDTIEEVVRISVGSGLATPEVVVREGFDARCPRMVAIWHGLDERSTGAPLRWGKVMG